MKTAKPGVHLALFLLVQARAFAPLDLLSSSLAKTPLMVKDTSSSSTSLYGLGTFLRRRFLGRVERRDRHGNIPQECQLIDSSIQPLYNKPKARMIPSVKSPVWSPSPNPTNFQSAVVVEAFDTGKAVLVAPAEPGGTMADLDEVTVPPRNEEELTKYEKEFRQMLVEFSKYSAKDIEHIRDLRLRTIFRGVMASYHIPQAYRAFEVLFEDYAPLRIGGRLIYAQLKQAMTDAQRERHEEVESITTATGLSKEEIDESRISFLRMVVHDDDKTAKLSIQQLVDYGLAETVVEVLGHDNFDEWVHENLNVTSTTEKVGFCELMIALQSCSVDSSQPECNPSTVLQEVARRMEPRQIEQQLDFSTVCQKKRRYAQRYNEMVDSFLEWKSFVPAGRTSRKLDVLHGCFAGAENERIVDALRIVYVDYSALRFAGDLIFKVMKAVVSGTGRMYQESRAPQ
jgi:hypothetical protein